ncbi:MAG: hypothetical protein B6U72_06430 [Candidatus Altiarchaeales archaeon ex4484_2]|nr:MAG: hypothetical protein B6U72_06430 [Candidatus Altiarchaeales archaeon ex4484_2]
MEDKKDIGVGSSGEEIVNEEALGEEALGEEEDKRFAFAMAPIVRLMRAELDSDKMIRSRVKVEMNLWLEKICRKIAAKINESDYTMVGLDDFKTAIEPYEMVDDVEQERHRIVASMEKIKQDCDSLIRDVNRKFVSFDGPVVRYGEETLDDSEADEADEVDETDEDVVENS